MRTLAEANDAIQKLWSNQSVRDRIQVFRLMRFVLLVEYKTHILLHNVVTGKLVALDKDEKKLLEHLPAAYSHEMDQLIEDHFLVPESFDEYMQVKGMRSVLHKLSNRGKKAIVEYTILPTTACNARCYYCFEQGSKAVTMTESITRNTVEFIEKHCGAEKTIQILWFGGEPTIAEKQIDQICTGLSEKGISFHSSMISNGLLFDERLVKKAKTLWNLEVVQISVDGTEQNYNYIKSYVNVQGSPYKKILDNIGFLTNNEIFVGVRMNFDLDNYTDFGALLTDFSDRDLDKRFFRIIAYPVIGEYPDKDGVIHHGTSSWFEDKILELNNLSRERGFYQENSKLPSLDYVGCGAVRSSAITITADGYLVRCPEQFCYDQITGDLFVGETNKDLVSDWKSTGDYMKCRDCVLFPACFRLLKCSAKENCFHFKEHCQKYRNMIIKKADSAALD